MQPSVYLAFALISGCGVIAHTPPKQDVSEVCLHATRRHAAVERYGVFPYVSCHQHLLCDLMQ